jgi:tetratricopeptide (TPR) repeat protein
VGFTASKILWLKRHEPRNFEKLATVLLPHNYLNYWLTGRTHMEYGDASGTGLMDIRRLGWDEAAVAAFQKANPQCQVLHRWEKVLRDAVAGTTRIRVRSGGTCHRDPAHEKTYFEITDTGEIRAFLDRLRIDEAASGGSCLCCGEPTFEFYAGGRMLAMIGFHHGLTLRWRAAWPGDAVLTGSSGEALCLWLKDHRVKRPWKERHCEEREATSGGAHGALLRGLLPPPLAGDILKAAEEAGLSREAAKVLAAGYAALKDWASALGYLNKLLAEATEVSVLNLAGECQLNLGRPDQALPLLQKSLQLDPNQPTVKTLLEKARAGIK